MKTPWLGSVATHLHQSVRVVAALLQKKPPKLQGCTCKSSVEDASSIHVSGIFDYACRRQSTECKSVALGSTSTPGIMLAVPKPCAL